MNRIPDTVFDLLPYFLVSIGLAVFFLPDGSMFRGSGLLAFLAGLGIFKLQMAASARKPIPNKVRNKATAERGRTSAHFLHS